MNIENYKDANSHIRADSNLSKSTLNAMLESNQKRSEFKKKSFKKSVFITAIAAILVVSGVVASAQTDIFSKLKANNKTIENSVDEYIRNSSDYLGYDYNTISQYSVPITEKSADLSIDKIHYKAEQYYFDGEYLFVAISAKNNNSKIKSEDLISIFNPTVTVNGNKVPCNSKSSNINLIRSDTEGEENCYSGTILISITDKSILQEENGINISSDTVFMQKGQDENTCAMTEIQLEPVNLSFGIKLTAPKPLNYDINREYDGFKITSIQKSVLGLKVKYVVPEKYGDRNPERVLLKDSYGEELVNRKYVVVASAYDENGDSLGSINAYDNSIEDYSLWMLFNDEKYSQHETGIFASPNSDKFTIKLENRNADFSPLAEFNINLSQYSPNSTEYDSIIVKHWKNTDNKRDQKWSMEAYGVNENDFVVYVKFYNQLNSKVDEKYYSLIPDDEAKAKRAHIEFYDTDGNKIITDDFDSYIWYYPDAMDEGYDPTQSGDRKYYAKCKKSDYEQIIVKLVCDEDDVLAEFTVDVP